MHRGSPAVLALCLSLLTLAARADDVMTSFHYMDIYNIEQSAAGIKDLKGLRAAVYVTSKTPGVSPEDITLTMHRASGAVEAIPHGAYAGIELPESDTLKAENPLIDTNQPRHTLDATVVIDLAPLTGTDLRYADLMLGVTQLDGSIEQKSLGVLTKLYEHKPTGLLVFYNSGEHRLTVHRKSGDRIVEGTSVDKVASHLKGVQAQALPPSAQFIYLPLDKALLKENPRVTLDAMPAQIFPAF